MRKIRTGDDIIVITGKDKGRRGTVLRVYDDERVLVEGINMVKKHRRQRGVNEPSGIIEMEAPIHVSNVRLVCRSCDKGVRVGFRFLDDGRKVRFCKQCDEAID